MFVPFGVRRVRKSPSVDSNCFSVTCLVPTFAPLRDKMRAVCLTSTVRRAPLQIRKLSLILSHLSIAFHNTEVYHSPLTNYSRQFISLFSKLITFHYLIQSSVHLIICFLSHGSSRMPLNFIHLQCVEPLWLSSPYRHV